MLYWIREIAGWTLVLVAVWMLVLAVSYAGDRKVVEAGVITLAGLGILRAGVLFVRISTAARIALQEIDSSKLGVAQPKTRGQESS